MAYEKQTWDTTSYVTPTRMNHIEDGIEGAGKSEVIGRITPTTNETLAGALQRLRSTYFSGWATNTKQLGAIKMTIPPTTSGGSDGVTDCIFQCHRWNSNSANAFFCVSGSASQLRAYGIFYSSGSTVVVRRYIVSSSGFTITDISDLVATSDIVFINVEY